MFWTCVGHVLDMFWTCVGHVWDIFWICVGHVSDWRCNFVLQYFLACVLKIIILYLVAKSQFWKKLACFGRNNYLFLLFGGHFTNQWSRLSLLSPLIELQQDSPTRYQAGSLSCIDRVWFSAPSAFLPFIRVSSRTLWHPLQCHYWKPGVITEKIFFDQ